MPNIKCNDYTACKSSCRQCDILSNKMCDKDFDFNVPKKYYTVGGRDRQLAINVCPTCGASIGYRPDDIEFRCYRCGQRILWKD